MGARGPAGKPTALKLLEGNPGKREVNLNEPKYPLSAESEKPPAWLGPYGKKEWRRIFPLLKTNGIMTDADYMALCGYCQNVDTWVMAEKNKRANGLTTVTSNGTEVQHPAVGISNTAVTNMLKFAKEFGLTPASRQNLTAEQFDENENPLMTLVRRARGEAGNG